MTSEKSFSHFNPLMLQEGNRFLKDSVSGRVTVLLPWASASRCHSQFSVLLLNCSRSESVGSAGADGQEPTNAGESM